MHHRFLARIAALGLIGCSSTAHQTAPAQDVVPIFAVDHTALSAEAARACEQRAPGTGERIRAAHDRWQVPNRTAQAWSLQVVEQQARLEAGKRGQPFVPFSQRQERWRAQSLQGLRDKMAALDDAAVRPYCERWPALFSQPDMQFAAMAATQPPSEQPEVGLLVDHQARFTEAARLCDARAPGSGAAVSQALGRWQARHGAAKDKLMDVVHAQATARADAAGGRILTLDSMKSWQRSRAIERQQLVMRDLSAAAVRPYCENLPREFERADMDFNAQWQAHQRGGR
jgi:hypothetical protein